MHFIDFLRNLDPQVLSTKSPIINLCDKFDRLSSFHPFFYTQLKELQSCGNRSHPKCIVRSSYREVIESLKNETAPKDNTTRLNGGDLVISINSLASIHNTSQEFNTETNKAFVDVVSNLLSTNNVDTWRQTQKVKKMSQLVLANNLSRQWRH